jgi:hypothetical protein
MGFTIRPLYHRERAPGIHCIGGWLGPRAGLDDAEKRKFLILLGLEPLLFVVEPVASCYTDYAIPESDGSGQFEKRSAHLP